ncbi:MAG TPA: redox-regulated ATPase YchF [Atribacteraceae bacterium]|nr:redox-regulated ATPase YchF [Atribacteraceae bacterium]
MGLKAGIIGLPNSGKTTIFNLLTANRALAASYPFSTILSNRGVASVPDHRLLFLEKLLKPPRLVPATVEFVDVAGLVRGASQGEGLGNRFLADLRGVDALVMVLRLFSDSQVTHVLGSVDPLRDQEVLTLELLLADLEVVERRLKKIADLERKVKDPAMAREGEVLRRCRDILADGRSGGDYPLTREDDEILREFQLLTRKPLIYVANCDESAAGGFLAEELRKHPSFQKTSLITVYGRLEEELSELPPEEQAQFFREFGIEHSGLVRLVNEAYRRLGLVTFFTFGDKELRAWEIPAGSLAPAAAGKVHTDMEKGFIRAEVINFRELSEIGSLEQARHLGKIRLEGKEYPVQDGDLLYFRFSPP